MTQEKELETLRAELHDLREQLYKLADRVDTNYYELLRHIESIPR